MKPRLFIPLLFTIATVIGCSGPEKMSVHQEENTLTVDGNLSNWDTNATRIYSDSEVDFYAASHGNYLYLFVDVKSPMKNYAIRQSGLIVYLSNSEKDRKKAGFAFPPGTLNLLREYPGAFDSFISEMDWGDKPENRELIERLSEDAFSRVMIVERPIDNNTPEYGFIDISQLEIDGFEIAADEDDRLISLEMKIPVGQTSLFDLEKGDIWLGFSIEPPEFNYRDPNSSLSSRQQRYTTGQRRPVNSSYSINYAMSRNLGKDDDWFIINLE